MPAVSKSQQSLFGMVRAAQRGELKASGKIKELAERMNPEAVRHFAATKTKGLPERKDKKEKKENEKSAEFIQMFVKGYLARMSELNQ